MKNSGTARETIGLTPQIPAVLTDMVLMQLAELLAFPTCTYMGHMIYIDLHSCAMCGII